jgi:hypothetical protein
MDVKQYAVCVSIESECCTHPHKADHFLFHIGAQFYETNMNIIAKELIEGNPATTSCSYSHSIPTASDAKYTERYKTL